MRKVEVRYSTAEDAVEFWGALPKFSFIGVTLRVDGEILALGGFTYEKTCLKAFCELRPGAESYPKAIVKGSRMVMRKAAAKGLLLHAVRDDQIESSERYLRRFGFVPVGVGADGSEVWQWRS
jgi:hypothetical protein